MTRFELPASIFTVDVDEKPIVSFEAKNLREAHELVRETWFRDDLMLLVSGGELLWDGEAPLRARFATEPEIERYRGIAAEAEDTKGDIVLAFLVPLDGVP